MSNVGKNYPMNSDENCQMNADCSMKADENCRMNVDCQMNENCPMKLRMKKHSWIVF